MWELAPGETKYDVERKIDQKIRGLIAEAVELEQAAKVATQAAAEAQAKADTVRNEIRAELRQASNQGFRLPWDLMA